MATVVQRFPDKSYEVIIDGKRHQAFTNEQLNEQARSFDTLQKTIDSLKLQLQAADKQIAAKVADVQALEEKVTVKEQERDRARADLQEAKGLIAQQRTMLDQEIAFRKESVQMIPKGQSHGFWGKTLDFVNSQKFQVFWKLGMPPVQTFLAARCTQ